VFTIFPRLKERKRPAGRHHVRRRAADAGHGPRADGRPKVLLLDEPSMGLSPIMVDKIFEVVATSTRQGVTILLVEQNASRALAWPTAAT
jgi:branched-chain amino acid transport system ATP-binding protein